MSWLSSLTGIHIGNSAKPIGLPTNIPPEIANNPEAMAQIQDITNKVNGTIANGNTMSHLAEGAAGLALAPVVAGAVTGGGAAAGAGAATAGAASSGGISGILSSIPGGSEILSLLSAGKIGLSDVASWLKNNGGTALEAANIANAAYRTTQADKYATQALQMEKDAYDAKAPLRSAGIAGMQYSANHGNPFAAGYNQATPVPTLPLAPANASGANTAAAQQGGQSLAQQLYNQTAAQQGGQSAAQQLYNQTAQVLGKPLLSGSSPTTGTYATLPIARPTPQAATDLGGQVPGLRLAAQ